MVVFVSKRAFVVGFAIVVVFATACFFVTIFLFGFALPAKRAPLMMALCP